MAAAAAVGVDMPDEADSLCCDTQPGMPNNNSVTVNELLCFISNEIDIMTQDILVKLCVDFYGKGVIESAKKLVYAKCKALNLIIMLPRYIKRQGLKKKQSDGLDIIGLCHETGCNLPVFVAQCISHLPSVSANSFDIASLMNDIEDMKMQLGLANMSRLSREINVAVQSITNTRLPDHVRPDNGTSCIDRTAVYAADGASCVDRAAVYAADGASCVDRAAASATDGASCVDRAVVYSVDGASCVDRATISATDGASCVDRAVVSPTDGASSVDRATVSATDGAFCVDRAVVSPTDGASCVNRAAVSVADGSSCVDRAAVDYADGASCVNRAAASATDGSSCFDRAAVYSADGSSCVNRAVVGATDGASCVDLLPLALPTVVTVACPAAFKLRRFVDDILTQAGCLCPV